MNMVNLRMYIRTDPHEWHNLAGDPRYAQVRQDLVKRVPTTTHEPLGR